MYAIDYHADDYGISPNNSNRLIELTKSGKLNSFSIIANMGCYEECMAMLKDNWSSFDIKPQISVHINLIDGYRLSSKKDDEIIRGSWGKLFLHSYLPTPGKSILKKQLTAEIKAQISRVYQDTRLLTDNAGTPVTLRLDSHVHTHMIPIVFDSMIDAIKELNLLEEVDYIRNSKEPLCMFLTTSGVRGTCPSVNAIKNILLNMLSHRVSKRCSSYNINTGMMWGLMMSGKMDHERVTILLPKMKKKASKKNLFLEILCHPGIVLESEMRPEYGPDDLIAFPSENRNIEYNMIAQRE